MLVQESIILTIACACMSVWLYSKWKQSLLDDNMHPYKDYCVTRGDMYCSHAHWCDIEISLYPEEYEVEMSKLPSPCINNILQGEGNDKLALQKSVR